MNTWAASSMVDRAHDRPLPRRAERAGGRFAEVLARRTRTRSNTSAPASTIRPGISIFALRRRVTPTSSSRHSSGTPDAGAEKVRVDVLRPLRLLLDREHGHLSEYLPWYRKRPDDISRWIDMTRWINGETGGYLRHCTEQRNWFETDFPRWLAEAGSPLSDYKRTDEHASYIIEALETGRVYRGISTAEQGLVRNLRRIVS